MKHILSFLFVLSSVNATATSYKVSPEEFTVIQTLLPDNKVEILACSYSNVGTDKELEYCTHRLADMNLKSQDFYFTETHDLELKDGISFSVFMTGSIMAMIGFGTGGTGFVVPAGLALWATGGTAFLSRNLHADEIAFEKSIHKQNLTDQKSRVFTFETEEDREDFLRDVRSAVEKVRNPYEHQPIQPSNYP